MSIATIQGLYYLLTGLWPIIHIKSFVAVTGPKTDIWLVKTTGCLISCIGLTLIVFGAQSNLGSAAFALGLSSSVFLTFIDVYYTIRKIIPSVYLIDAAAQCLIIISWCLTSAAYL